MASMAHYPGYEPLRRNIHEAFIPSSVASPASARTPFERPPSTDVTNGGRMTGTPVPPSHSAMPSFDSAYQRPSIEQFNERRSIESSRVPFLPNKKHSPGNRTGSIRNRNYPEEMSDDDREGPSFGGPVPFMPNRGSSLSFYDMKKQKEDSRRPSPPSSAKVPPPMTQRNSWLGTEMPYNYADMIGGNRQAPYAPPHMGQQSGNVVETSEMLRLPWTMWMNSEVKNHFVATIGEWIGTTMFLFFAFAGTQVANAKSVSPAGSNTTTNATAGFSPIVMLYIAISFGFSLMVNVWIFFRISGGLFNPTVTLALWATGAVKSVRAICLFFAQIVGSITASALVLAIFPTPLNVRTTLSDGTSVAQGLFIEAIATAELVFTILMLAKEKHRATFIAPVGIGLALFVAELVGVYYTGGSLNPARSLGPCIVTNQYDSEHWIYWLGPFIGCVFALAFYKFIKILEYEMANPGQDGDETNDPTKNDNHEVREKQREATARVLARLGFIPAQYLPSDPAEQQHAVLSDLERQADDVSPGNNMNPPATRNGSIYREPMTVRDLRDLYDGPNGGSYPAPALSTVASISSPLNSPPNRSNSVVQANSSATAQQQQPQPQQQVPVQAVGGQPPPTPTVPQPATMGGTTA